MNEFLVFLIGLAVVLVLIIFISNLRHKRFLQRSKIAVVTITEFIRYVDNDGDVPYFYVSFEFPVQGSVCTVKKLRTSHKYQIGEKVKIHYSPGNPQQAKIDVKPDERKFKLGMFAYIAGWIWGTLAIAFFPHDGSYEDYIFFGMLWLYFGFMFGVPIGYVYWDSWRLQVLGESAVATITSYITKDSDGLDISHQQFEFTARGKVYTVPALYVMGKYQTGDKVKIHYRKKDPQQAELDDYKAQKSLLVVACLSIIACIIGVLHFVFRANGIVELYSIIATKLLY